MNKLRTAGTCFVLWGLLLFSVPELNAQNETLKDQYDKLVSQKRYLDAYMLIDKTDPGNEKEQTVLLKSDLCVRYFAKSADHRFFSFVNIVEGKTLEQVRAESSTSSLQNFSPEQALIEKIEKNPSNKQLHHLLGLFYYEKCLHYVLTLSPEEQTDLLDKSSTYISAAHEAGVYDWYSYYILGYIALEKKEIPLAFSHLQKSVELNPSEGLNCYNFAYCCMTMDKFDLAQKYAELAAQNYPRGQLKLDSAYFAFRMSIALVNRAESSRLAKAYFALDPGNPRVLRNIVQDMALTPYSADILVLITQFQKDYPANAAVMGNTYLYRSQYYANLKDIKSAKADLLKAKEIFANIYSADHAIMRFIEHTEKELQNAGKAGSEAVGESK